MTGVQTCALPISDTDKSEKEKFSINNFKETVSGLFESVKGFFSNIKFEITMNTLIVISVIALGIILSIVFIIIYNKSYVIRQKIANYKNKKRASKQYVIIKETRKSKGRRRRNR